MLETDTEIKDMFDYHDRLPTYVSRILENTVTVSSFSKVLQSKATNSAVFPPLSNSDYQHV